MVEGARLESVCASWYRGFESHPLRSFLPRRFRGKSELVAPKPGKGYGLYQDIGERIAEPSDEW